MSSPRWILPLIAGCVVTTAEAQRDHVERYEAMIPALQNRLAELNDNADLFDGLFAAKQNGVEFSAGGFSLTAPLEFVDAVREGAVEADAFLVERLGPAANLVPRPTLVVDVTSRLVPIRNPRGSSGPLETRRVYQVQVRGRDGSRIGGSGAGDRGRIAELTASWLRHAAQEAFREQIDPDLLAWSGNHAWPSAEFEFRPVFHELATSDFRITRACLSERSACVTALGLDHATDRLDAWYPGADLRRLVLRRVGDRRGNLPSETALARLAILDRRHIEACHAGDRARCYAYLDGIDVWPPTSPMVRAGVLEIAFRIGGDGAVDRMLNSEGSIRQRLEYIADAPLPHLLDQWLEVSAATVGRPTTIPLGTGILAVVWIAAFGAMSLRSTRWR